MLDGVERSCADYEWSSLAQGYRLPPTKRPKWLVVAEGLNLYGEKDTAKGRRELICRYDKWIADETGIVYEIDGGTFESRVKRGWYWGSETFKEKMLSLLAVENPRECRSFESSETLKDWNIERAKEILKAGEALYGKPLEQLIENCYNDWTRTSLAWAVWNETSVSHAWLAEHLNLKSAANSSQQIRRFAQLDHKKLPARIQKWKKSRNAG